MRFKYDMRILEMSRIEDLPSGIYEVEPFYTTYRDRLETHLITRIEVSNYCKMTEVFMYNGGKIIWAWPDSDILGVPEYVTILSRI